MSAPFVVEREHFCVAFHLDEHIFWCGGGGGAVWFRYDNAERSFTLTFYFTRCRCRCEARISCTPYSGRPAASSRRTTGNSHFYAKSIFYRVSGDVNDDDNDDGTTASAAAAAVRQTPTTTTSSLVCEWCAYVCEIDFMHIGVCICGVVCCKHRYPTIHRFRYADRRRSRHQRVCAK